MSLIINETNCFAEGIIHLLFFVNIFENISHCSHSWRPYPIIFWAVQPPNQLFLLWLRLDEEVTLYPMLISFNLSSLLSKTVADLGFPDRGDESVHFLPRSSPSWGSGGIASGKYFNTLIACRWFLMNFVWQIKHDNEQDFFALDFKFNLHCAL